MDFQKFLQGKAFDAYEYFGAHLTEEGAVFRVYAPGQKPVCIINMRSQVRMDKLFTTAILMECLWNFVLDLHPGS